MSEYGFFLTRMFPYKDRIFDSVLIREYTSQRKPILLHILRNVEMNKIFTFTAAFAKTMIF